MNLDLRLRSRKRREAARARADLCLWAWGVDQPWYNPPMAPDAPPPVYDSMGNEVAQWSMTIGYDAVRDQLYALCRQDAGPYTKAKREDITLDATELEDLAAWVQRRLRILGARRLF